MDEWDVVMNDAKLIAAEQEVRKALVTTYATPSLFET